MLTILLNGQTVLDIDTDTSITLEYSNPLFVFDGLPGMASYQFTIPASPQNNHAFEHANTIAANTGAPASYPAQLQVNGVPLLNGYLTIEAATPYRYTCTLQSDFLHRLRDVNLAEQFRTFENVEFDLSGLVLPMYVYDTELFLPDITTWVNSANAGTYPTFSHAFPLFYSDTFFGKANEDPLISDAWTNQYPHNYFNLLEPPYGTPPAAQNDIIVPWLYVVFVILKTFEKQNFSVTGNIETDTEFNTLLLYGNYAQNKLDYYNSLPQITIAEFLADLRQKFNIVFFFGTNQNVEIWFARDLATNAPVIDITQKVQPLYAIQFNETLKEITLCYNDDSTDKFADDYNLSLSEYTLTDSVVNIDNLPAGPEPPTDLYYVITENAFYRYTTTEDPNNPGTDIETWVRYTYNYNCYNKNGKGKKIESSLPLLPYEQVRYNAINPAITWVTPRIEAFGNTSVLYNPTGTYPAVDFFGHPQSLRYAFYRGLRPDSSNAINTEYALATPTKYDAAGTQCGNYTLDYNGTDGIYANFWQPFISRIQNTKVVEKTLAFTAHDLAQLNMAAKYQVQEQAGLAHYFIKTLTVTITQNGIQQTKCSMVQIL